MQKVVALGLLAAAAALAQQTKFEIADVHVSPTAYWFAHNAGGTIRDGRYINRDASLLNLIQAAYGVTEDMIAGGPGWIKSELFDVVAKVPDGATPESVKPMLQALLAERFGLAIRQETRPMPRYVLSVGKGGSKLKPAAASPDSGCRIQPLGAGRGDGQASPNVKAICHNLTTAGIAENLPQLAQIAGNYNNTYLPHQVMDSTGLSGAWDFEFEFTPIGFLPVKGRDGITLADALSKQLGLNLELKNVPALSLTIESVNRKPTANSPEAAKELAMAEPQFEAAAIKAADPSKPRPAFAILRYAGGSQLGAGGTLHSLLALSLQIQPNAANDVIIGLPKSADSQVWDITAKLPGTGEGAPNVVKGRAQPPQLSVIMRMLHGLLVDQFDLKTHIENREVTVYALTQGEGKLKMTRADPSERDDCRPDPNAPKPFPNMSTMVKCTNLTMGEFARNLEQATGFFDHPIVDATGLEGGWDFMIGWSPVIRMPQPNPNQPAGTAADAPDLFGRDREGGISSYDAVQKLTGLKLVKQKRSIPVVVVDHASENPVE